MEAICQELSLFFAIALYFKFQKKLSLISFIILGFCVVLIFLSGERAAFIKTLIGIVILFLIINVKWKTKILFLTVFIASIIVIVLNNQVIFDRYVNQMKNQIFERNEKNNELFFMSNYYPMYETSLKMFFDNKLIGMGPKSYRYHCSNQIIFHIFQIKIYLLIIQY